MSPLIIITLFLLLATPLSIVSALAPKACASCVPAVVYAGFDLGGDDLVQVQIPSLDPSLCSSLCCQRSQCVAFVSAIAPTANDGCAVNQPCCYLKFALGDMSPSGHPTDSLSVGLMPLTACADSQTNAPGVDVIKPNVWIDIAIASVDINLCAAQCCDNPGCVSATVKTLSAADISNSGHVFAQCTAGKPCCLLRNSVETAVQSNQLDVTTAFLNYAQ